MFNKAIKKYTPSIFPGDVNLFLTTADKNNSVLAWQEFISGKMEDHTLSCGHWDIFKEPYDSELADKLKLILLDAHDNLKYRKQKERSGDGKL